MNSKREGRKGQASLKVRSGHKVKGGLERAKRPVEAMVPE